MLPPTNSDLRFAWGIGYLGAVAGEGGVAERVEVARGVLSNRQVTRAPRSGVDKPQALIGGD